MEKNTTKNIIVFPDQTKEPSKELKKEWEELEMQADREAGYIAAYMDDEPEDNPIIRKYRENLYNELIDDMLNGFK